MKRAVDLAKILALKARGDRYAAQTGFSAGVAPEIIGFHLQQAAEKWLKALLASLNEEYPKTHDLIRLLDLVVVHWPNLDRFREPLRPLGLYAVELRYDDVGHIDSEDLLRQASSVDEFVEAVAKHLPPEVLT